MTLLSVRREVGEFRKRYKWMALAVAVAMSAIVSRLVYLQIIDYDRWAKEAQDNITKHVRLPATRGLIRDTSGKIIANNRAATDVYLTPQLLDHEDIDLISQLMGFGVSEKAELFQRLADVPERRRSHLVKMYSDITREQLAAL